MTTESMESQDSSPPLTVSFRLSHGDHLAYNRYVNARDPSLRATTLLRHGSLPFYAVAVCLWYGAPLWQALLIGLGVLAVWSPFLTILWKYRIRRYARTSGSIFPEVTVTVSGDGVRQRSPGIDTSIQWPNVKNLYETTEYVFFMLGKREGLIVPKSAFEYPSAAAVFACAAREWRLAARDDSNIGTLRNG